MTAPRWLDEREARTWRTYLAARRALDAAVERQLAEAGISDADWALLVPLSEADGDVLRARDLARLVGWDRSRLSHQLRRMEGRGLLERSDCSTDARGTMIALTPQGRSVVERVAPGHVATVRRVFVDALGPGDADVLDAVLGRVLDAACPGGPPDDADCAT